MSRGRNFNVYLLDAEPNGVAKYSAKNLTILAYKIPRTKLDSCKNISALKQTGVYFLFGTDDETGKRVVYVGQAVVRQNGEGLLNRLQEHRHNPDKDYWTQAVCFTTTDNSFGPTEVSYLEHRFCAMAKDANQYIVKNGNTPNIGHVSEETVCELEEFIQYATLLMGTLIGHDVFVPLVPTTVSTNQNESDAPVALYCTRKETKATGYQTADGFVVLKGATIAKELTNSCPDSIKALREKHKAIISPEFITLDDIPFSSPSSAAGFVCGGSYSGNDSWKTDAGISLKDLEK